MSLRGAAVILYSGDEMILVRHGEQSHHPTGRYSIVGGSSEPEDMDAWDTVGRETYEETGLRVENGSLRFLRHLEFELGRKDGGTVPVSINLFACEADRNAELSAKYETEPVWVKIDDYLRGEYPITYASGDFLDVVKGYLLGKLDGMRGFTTAPSM